MVRRPPALLAPYVESIVGYRMLGYHPGEHVGMPSRHLTFMISFDDPLELSVLPGLAPPVLPLRRPARRPAHEPASSSATTASSTASCSPSRRPAHGRCSVCPPARWRRRWCRSTCCGDASPVSSSTGSTPRRQRGRQRFAVVEGVLLRALTARVEIPSGARPETSEAWRRLEMMAGRVDIAALAAEVGWSRRHLTERFTAEYGVGPKQLARVLRFEQSKAMLVRPRPAHAGQHRRRVWLRRPGAHGAGLARHRRFQPDAVAGRRAAPIRPRRRTVAGRMMGSWKQPCGPSSTTATPERRPPSSPRRSASSRALVVPGETDDVVVHGELRWPEGGG